MLFFYQIEPKGLFELAYLNLPTGINTCETIQDNLWKQLMINHVLFGQIA